MDVSSNSSGEINESDEGKIVSFKKEIGCWYLYNIQDIDKIYQKLKQELDIKYLDLNTSL